MSNPSRTSSRENRHVSKDAVRLDRSRKVDLRGGGILRGTTVGGPEWGRQRLGTSPPTIRELSSRLLLLLVTSIAGSVFLVRSASVSYCFEWLGRGVCSPVDVPFAISFGSGIPLSLGAREPPPLSLDQRPCSRPLQVSLPTALIGGYGMQQLTQIGRTCRRSGI